MRRATVATTFCPTMSITLSKSKSIGHGSSSPLIPWLRPSSSSTTPASTTWLWRITVCAPMRSLHNFRPLTRGTTANIAATDPMKSTPQVMTAVSAAASRP